MSRMSAAGLLAVIDAEGFEDALEHVTPAEVPEFIEALWREARLANDTLNDAEYLLIDKLMKKAERDGNS